jgi:Mannosyl-glycoprotein endo-beta-N-acetylglucosaminidase
MNWVRTCKVVGTLSLTALTLVACAGPPSAFCQSRNNIPLPEYYGIYAVVDSQLVKLDSEQIRVNKTVGVRLGQRNGVGNILNGEPVAASKTVEVPEFTADLKIIVFSQTSGLESPLDIANSLHLEALVFVRNVSIDTGWPQNVRRSGTEDGWDAGNAPELLGLARGDRAKSLEFLVKPVTGQPDMVVAELPEKLRPGVYRLTRGERNPLFGNTGLAFAVEPISEGEATKCVDASIKYFMNISNTKYAPCMDAPQTAGNRAPSSSVTQQLAEQVRTIVAASYEKSPLNDLQFLELIIGRAEQAGVPPWLLFGQARFETTFGNPINGTTRDGVTFTDGTTGNAHNLFNIRPGPSWSGKVLDTGQGGLFRVYDTYEDCVRDYLQLMSSGLYGGKTLEQVINTYFPASENGSARVESYVDSVIDFARKLGFKVTRATVPMPANLAQRSGLTFPAPTPISPTDGSIFDRFPRTTTLVGASVPGASSYVVQVDYYDPQNLPSASLKPGWVSEREGRIYIQQATQSTSYTFEFVGAQPGRWRVWAVGSNAQEGAKSDWMVFRYTR